MKGERPPDTEGYPELPVRFAPGVGRKKVEILERLGIRTVGELLWHVPLYYEDRSTVVPVARLEGGKRQVTAGRVMALGVHRVRTNLTMLKVAVQDETGTVYAVWYNQQYLRGQLTRGTDVMLSGRVRRRGHTVEMQVEDWDIVRGRGYEPVHVCRIVPVYPLTEGISQRLLRRVMQRNVAQWADRVEDPLPGPIRERHGLPSFSVALRNIHFPRNVDAQRLARRRFIFEELFWLQVALALRRRHYRRTEGIAFAPAHGLIRRFLQGLDFTLTAAQQRVLREILDDMAQPRTMNRLLQGDVGSGKTVVAVAAILNAVDSGYQAALMAPTEILAHQHYIRVERLLQRLGVRAALLVSELAPKEKERVREDIETGAIQVVVGTHALIQTEIAFHKLGLVIVDEQHRFGVLQRASLRAKGASPDTLVMTATPIPRTLALTSHGDLDVSNIDQLPPGRKPVVTRWVSQRRQHEVYAFLREEFQRGRQAYVICPLIEESAELDLRPAQETATRLQEHVFPGVKIGLLHGRMGREEKRHVMAEFERGATQILVSTTVIEVGIDVPNASLMVIENAERFGLAQLHQLRGRVGRGTDQAYCFLMTGEEVSETGVQRMKIMSHTNDGFRIAEEDLMLRGPGEFFGTRQWGDLNFRVADLRRDGRQLLEARREAFSLVKSDPGLEQHPELRRMVHWRFQQALPLGDVG